MTNKEKLFSIFFLLGALALGLVLSTEHAAAQTFDFDEGMEVLTEGLISARKGGLKGEKIAVFGIIESKSGEKWEISSPIEDAIVDVLVNKGYTVIERRRIEDIIKKELKNEADLWFDETQVSRFGKLMGADVVVTGNYAKWGGGTLRVSIRAINVEDGKVLAANKVKIHTDRIAEMLRPVETKETQGAPGKKAARPSDSPRSDAENAGDAQPDAFSQEQNPSYQQQGQSPAPPPPQLGYYCCDQFGNRRCTLVQPLPLGSSCFCFGQGYGYVCP